MSLGHLIRHITQHLRYFASAVLVLICFGFGLDDNNVLMIVSNRYDNSVTILLSHDILTPDQNPGVGLWSFGP